MKGWALHCCLLNEERWGPLGCDIPKYAGKGIPRIEASTPWFHASLALAPSGRFGRLRGYRPDMTREQARALPVAHHWFLWIWKKKENRG